MGGRLTKAEAGRLGGLTTAHNLGADGVKRRASKGGAATLAKLGRAHFARAAYMRWGRLAVLHSEKAPAAAPSQEVCRDADKPST